MKQAHGITEWGRSKTADIKRLRESGLADKDARMLTAADLIEYCKARRIVDGAGPATVLNDIVWLRQAFLSGAAMFDITQPVTRDVSAGVLLGLNNRLPPTRMETTLAGRVPGGRARGPAPAGALGAL